MPLKKDHTIIISYLIAAIILCANPIWPLWGGIGTVLGYALLLCLTLLKYKKIGNIVSNFFYGSTFLLMCICFIVHPLFVGFHASNILIILSFIVALTLTDEEKIKALNCVTIFLAVVIVISLPAWLVHLFIFEFPIFSEIDNSDFKGVDYIVNNHLLFVTASGASTFRFYSMFDEPGVLGTLSAFVLYGNQYNFENKRNVVILLGAFFSFSLAFYVMTLIGYMFLAARNIRKFIVSIFLVCSVILMAILFLQDNLAFQYSIIDRFSNSALENIDRRTGYRTAQFYNEFVETPSALLGIGANGMKIRGLDDGQSYKLFILEYGWISIICLLLMYSILAGKFTRSVVMCFLLFIMSFLQRPFAFNVWQILLFTCIVAACRNFDKKKIYHDRSL